MRATGFFAFRVPAWPLRLLTEGAGDDRARLAALAARPEFRGALSVASPDLLTALEDRPADAGVEAALVRYVSRMASRASASVTPSISKSTRPGRTTHTHCSGAPLPLPIRVSCGFFVIGLSGKTRTQILPPRLTKRVIATRAASICRSVSQHGSSALRP